MKDRLIATQPYTFICGGWSPTSSTVYTITERYLCPLVFFLCLILFLFFSDWIIQFAQKSVRKSQVSDHSHTGSKVFIWIYTGWLLSDVFVAFLHRPLHYFQNKNYQRCKRRLLSEIDSLIHQLEQQKGSFRSDCFKGSQQQVQAIQEEMNTLTGHLTDCTSYIRLIVELLKESDPASFLMVNWDRVLIVVFALEYE